MENVHSGGMSNTPAQRTTSKPSKFVKHRLLIDWVGFTLSLDTYDLHWLLDFMESTLGIDKRVWREGRKNYEGYARSLHFENIYIYYEGQEEQGIHVDITGQGCRFLEILFKKTGVQKLNWYVFISELFQLEDCNFTRFDVAYDDMQGLFDINILFQKCMNGEVTSKFKTWRPAGNFRFDGSCDGMTLYFGSRNSRIQIRIYEKDKQLDIDMIWNRIEIQFNHERAKTFIKYFLEHHELSDSNVVKDIGVLFGGVLKDYLNFRDRKESDSNKRRWPVSEFWSNMLDGIERLRLATALPDRSIQKTHGWFEKSISKSFAMLNLAYAGIHDDWLYKLNELGLKKITERELMIIEEYRKLFETDYNSRIDTEEIFWGEDESFKHSREHREKKNKKRTTRETVVPE